MKSKLTLLLDDDLAERAKKLADKQDISTSKLVEDYFRLFPHGPEAGEPPLHWQTVQRIQAESLNQKRLFLPGFEP